MENRSARRKELRLLAVAIALPALALAFACARPPLSHGAVASIPAQSFVVTTRTPPAPSTQVAAHIAPDAQAEAESEAELEDDPEAETEGEMEEPTSYDAVFSEAEVERYEEKESGVTFGPMAIYSALIVQRVSSYDAWRSAFDAQLPARRSAGFTAQAVLRGAFDSKLVAVWLAATDLVQAKGYLRALTTRDPHAKAAAKSGKPKVQLARNLSSKLEPARPGLHAALVTLEVDDLPSFRDEFAADAERRTELGVLGWALTQNVDDESEIYLYLQSEDPARLKAYLSSQETRRAWHDSGVVTQKSATIVREGELSLCQ